MNKGVSSLIVSILLILITISLAMAFYSWGMDISLRFRENTETMTNHTISKAKASFFITTVSATEIGIKNNGETPLDMSAFQVYINDTLVEVIPNVSTLQPQGVTTLNITSPFTPGNYTIKVSGPYGKYDQTFDELETISTGTTTTSSTTSSTTTTTILCFSGFDYRTEITVDNTANSNSLSDYQVLVTLTSSNFNYSKSQLDGSDIRFTDSDKTSSLNYWIEEWNYGGTSNIWVKVPSIPASSSKTIYMYYGNQSPATSESNGDTTWDYFLEWTSDHTSEFTTQYWVPDGSVNHARRRTHHKTISTLSSPLKVITKFRVYDYNPHSYAGGVGFGLADDVTDEYPDTSISYRFHADSDLSGVDNNNFGVRIRSDVSGTSTNTNYKPVPYDSGIPWRYSVFRLNNNKFVASIYSSDWTEIYSDTVTTNLPASMDNIYYKTYAQDTAGWHEWSYDSSNNEIDMGGGRWSNDGYIRISYKWVAVGNYSSSEPSTSVGSEVSCS